MPDYTITITEEAEAGLLTQTDKVLEFIQSKIEEMGLAFAEDMKRLERKNFIRSVEAINVDDRSVTDEMVKKICINPTAFTKAVDDIYKAELTAKENEETEEFEEVIKG